MQVLSAKHIGAEKLYTGNKLLHEVALREGLESEYTGYQLTRALSVNGCT